MRIYSQSVPDLLHGAWAVWRRSNRTLIMRRMWWFDGIWDTQSEPSSRGFSSARKRRLPLSGSGGWGTKPAGLVVRAKQGGGAAACNPGESTERDSASDGETWGGVLPLACAEQPICGPGLALWLHGSGWIVQKLFQWQSSSYRRWCCSNIEDQLLQGGRCRQRWRRRRSPGGKT